MTAQPAPQADHREATAMPIIIAALVVAVLLGLFAQRRTAIIGTAVACAGILFTFTWAVADGRGNDPWWIMLIALAGCAVALALAATLPQVRRHVRS